MGIFSRGQDPNDLYGVKSDRPSMFRMPDSYADKISNRRYHNHFRGYTEIRRTDESGRVKIERFYVSPWKVSGLSNLNYWLVRILYLLLTAGAAALYIIAMSRDVPANKHWAVAIPGFPTIICMFLVFVRIADYFLVPRKMTLWDFESSSGKLKRWTMIAAIVTAVTAGAMFVFAILKGDGVVLQTVLCGLMDTGAAVCLAAIRVIESKVPYHDEENDTMVPEGERYDIR